MTTTVRHATRRPAFHLKPCLLAVALAGFALPAAAAQTITGNQERR